MSSLAAERQQIILDLLHEKKTIKIHELVEQLQASPMTVHRDLQKMAAAGLVTKIHGGVTKAGVYLKNLTLSNVCAICGNSISSRTSLIIHNIGSNPLHSCCPHCGLILLSRQQDSVTALTTDFIYGQMVNALESIYLVNSIVNICCSPSILSFAKQKDARRFQLGFGGQVMSFTQTQRYLLDANRFNQKHHHQNKIKATYK